MRPPTAAVTGLLFGLLGMVVDGCGGTGLRPDTGPDSSVLPSPSSRPVPPGRILHAQLSGLRRARVLAVDEDLQTGSREVEVRLTLGGHGTVVDATSQPIGFGSGPGYEVFRSPGTLLQRPAGTGNPCWSAGGDAAGRYDVAVAPEVALLHSVAATSVADGVMHGTVSARALLGLLGSGPQLRARGLEVPAAGRVPATFTTSYDALEITASWSSLSRLAGAGHGATGTWTVRYRTFGTSGPSAPAADMMCP